MRAMGRAFLAACIAACVGSPAHAGDVYALLGMAIGSSPEPCTYYQWTGNVLFHNAGDSDAVIRGLNASNGRPPTGAPVEFVIPPHRTDSLHAGSFFAAPLFVGKFDVPDRVVVESRIELGTQYCTLNPPPANPNRGKLSFPVYRSLQPPNLPKIHLGTDLGLIDARNNVAIYNAGAVTANAQIEVHRGCDDSLIDSRDVAIPAYSVVSANGLAVASGLAPCGTTAPYVTYVTVVVDQPSLSWVSTLANGKDLSVVYTATSSSP